MFRLETIGIAGDVIPLTQIDLADAAGLSVVHVNRTIQDLRELGPFPRIATASGWRTRIGLRIAKSTRATSIRHLLPVRRLPASSAHGRSSEQAARTVALMRKLRTRMISFHVRPVVGQQCPCDGSADFWQRPTFCVPTAQSSALGTTPKNSHLASANAGASRRRLTIRDWEFAVQR